MHWLSRVRGSGFHAGRAVRLGRDKGVRDAVAGARVAARCRCRASPGRTTLRARSHVPSQIIHVDDGKGTFATACCHILRTRDRYQGQGRTIERLALCVGRCKGWRRALLGGTRPAGAVAEYVQCMFVARRSAHVSGAVHVHVHRPPARPSRWVPVKDCGETALTSLDLPPTHAAGYYTVLPYGRFSHTSCTRQASAGKHARRTLSVPAQWSKPPHEAAPTIAVAGRAVRARRLDLTHLAAAGQRVAGVAACVQASAQRRRNGAAAHAAHAGASGCCRAAVGARCHRLRRSLSMLAQAGMYSAGRHACSTPRAAACEKWRGRAMCEAGPPPPSFVCLWGHMCAHLSRCSTGLPWWSVVAGRRGRWWWPSWCTCPLYAHAQGWVWGYGRAACNAARVVKWRTGGVKTRNDTARCGQQTRASVSGALRCACTSFHNPVTCFYAEQSRRRERPT